MNLPSLQQLKDIFYSGQYGFTGNPEPIVKIHFLLEQKYLTHTQIVIAPKEQYLNLASDTTKLQAELSADGGGSNHVALKLLARDYLSQFGFEAKCEQPFCGFYPDVITTDKQTVVECGHTDNAEKIFTYFTQGNIAELIQIPYPTSEDNYVYGHQFTPQKNLTDFLLFEARSEDDKIKRIINRDRNDVRPTS